MSGSPAWPTPAHQSAAGRQPRLRGTQALEARATLVAQLRIVGHTQEQIAERLGLSTTTIKDDLKRAKRLQLIQRGQAEVFGMIPAALQVYYEKLDEGSLEAARDVLKTTGLLTNGAVRVNVTTPVDAEETLEVWRERTLERLRIRATPTASATRPGAVIDVTPEPAADSGGPPGSGDGGVDE